MKKLVYLSLALVLIAVTMQSCSKNTPKDVAYTWLTGFNHMDFENAKKVSTPDTKVLLATLEQMTDKVSDSNKKDLKKVVITIKDVKVTGDKAVATYTASDNPGKEQTLNLVNQNGNWLVLFTKVDLYGGMPGKDEEQPVEGENVMSADSAADASMVDTTKHQ